VDSDIIFSLIEIKILEISGKSKKKAAATVRVVRNKRN